MKYQSWFYYRSDNPDPATHYLMQALGSTQKIDELYAELNAHPAEEETHSLIFQYRTLDNFDQRLEKLKEFEKTAREAIKIQPVRIEGITLSFPFDYVRDGKGKIEPEILFSRWDQILKIHKMRRKLKPAEICHELGIYKEDDPNSFKPVNRALKKAEELIKSTLTATFPYPENKTKTVIIPDL